MDQRIHGSFLRQVEEGPRAAQEEFLELIHDHSAKDGFDSMELESFGVQMKCMYPLLSKKAMKLLIPFSSTYLCKAGFSSAVVIKTKFRNKLELEDDLRCLLSTIEPRIKKYTSNQLLPVSVAAKTRENTASVTRDHTFLGENRGNLCVKKFR